MEIRSGRFSICIWYLPHLQTIYETDDDNLLIAASLGAAFDLRAPPVEMLRYATAKEGEVTPDDPTSSWCEYPR